jgi:hypothetical protein
MIELLVFTWDIPPVHVPFPVDSQPLTLDDVTFSNDEASPESEIDSRLLALLDLGQLPAISCGDGRVKHPIEHSNQHHVSNCPRGNNKSFSSLM